MTAWLAMGYGIVPGVRREVGTNALSGAGSEQGAVAADGEAVARR